MDQTADFADVARALIAGGESYYVEFKGAWQYGEQGGERRDIRAIAQDIGETVVAFANSDGGDLLVGVEDDGTTTGIPWDGDQLRYLVQAPTHQVQGGDIGTTVHQVPLEGHRVLLFRVPENTGEPVVTSIGRCLWRKGARTEPIPPEDIKRRRNERLGDTRYEAEPVPEATLDDLLEFDDIVGRRRPLFRGARGEALNHLDDVRKALRYWNLADARNGTLVLRRAALILFAKDPLRWHPNNRIRVRRVHGFSEGYGANLRTREREAAGPVVKLLPRAIRILHRDLSVDRKEQNLFSTAQLLPREAVEETLVNAIIHRNYAIEGQAVEVLLYPDRAEFRSPGSLPSPITVEDLYRQRGVHRSRNPLMMRVLRDLGWARDQGEGMRRIFGAMSQVELHQPELEETGDTFVVRLSTRSRYDDSTRTWLASYGPFGLEPEERRYMVGLRSAGGRLSVDRLARQLGESFDDTKKALVGLEDKGMVWHRYKSRTYHVVEPLKVPHERAYRLLAAAEVAFSPTTRLGVDDLADVTGLEDRRSASALADRWTQTGILAPAGKKRWRLAPGLLEYAASR